MGSIGNESLTHCLRLLEAVCQHIDFPAQLLQRIAAPHLCSGLVIPFSQTVHGTEDHADPAGHEQRENHSQQKRCGDHCPADALQGPLQIGYQRCLFRIILIQVYGSDGAPPGHYRNTGLTGKNSVPQAGRKDILAFQRKDHFGKQHITTTARWTIHRVVDDTGFLIRYDHPGGSLFVQQFHDLLHFVRT